MAKFKVIKNNPQKFAGNKKKLLSVEEGMFNIMYDRETEEYLKRVKSMHYSCADDDDSYLKELRASREFMKQHAFLQFKKDAGR